MRKLRPDYPAIDGDALVGRMISADPTVPDPSSYSWLSSFLQRRQFLRIGVQCSADPAVHLQIAITVVMTLLVGPIVAAAAGAAIIIGLSGGNLGQMLRAGAIAAATASAFNVVSGATNAMANHNPVGDMPAHIQPAFGTELHAFNVAGHALVECGLHPVALAHPARWPALPPAP